MLDQNRGAKAARWTTPRSRTVTPMDARENGAATDSLGSLQGRGRRARGVCAALAGELLGEGARATGLSAGVPSALNPRRRREVRSGGAGRARACFRRRAPCEAWARACPRREGARRTGRHHRTNRRAGADRLEPRPSARMRSLFAAMRAARAASYSLSALIIQDRRGRTDDARGALSPRGTRQLRVGDLNAPRVFSNAVREAGRTRKTSAASALLRRQAKPLPGGAITTSRARTLESDALAASSRRATHRRPSRAREPRD